MTLLRPFSERLEEIQNPLHQITRPAEAALETGMAAQEEIHRLQKA